MKPASDCDKKMKLATGHWPGVDFHEIDRNS